MTVAALYVETNGVYYGLDDVDPWDEARDARKYAGPWPVVAHPPCQRWCQLAPLNASRLGDGYAVGDDKGCFAAALSAVRQFGGVLEHPALSYAWPAFGLPRPPAARPRARERVRVITGRRRGGLDFRLCSSDSAVGLSHLREHACELVGATLTPCDQAPRPNTHTAARVTTPGAGHERLSVAHNAPQRARTTGAPALDNDEWQPYTHRS